MKVYFGCDQAARLAASAFPEAHFRRKVCLASRKRHQKLLKRARDERLLLDCECEKRLEVALGIEGYHRVNHGPWRRRRVGPSFPRSLRTETPEVAEWLVQSDSLLVHATREPWIELLVGNNLELGGELGRSADQVRDTLVGEDFRSDVRLLAERAAVAWLALEYENHLQSQSATVSPTERPGQRGAVKRLRRAVNDVATIRRLSPLVVARPLTIDSMEDSFETELADSSQNPVFLGNFDRAVG